MSDAYVGVEIRLTFTTPTKASVWIKLGVESIEVGELRYDFPNDVWVHESKTGRVKGWAYKFESSMARLVLTALEQRSKLHRGKFAATDLQKVEGDFVVLNSGGPLMRVITREGDQVLCDVDGAQQMFDYRLLSRLKPMEPPEPV